MPSSRILKKAYAIARKKQIGEEARHEEGEGVEKRKDAEPRDRLAEKFGSQRAGTGTGR